jgi:hypothetical protein
MAALITLALVTIIIGTCVGAFLKISFTISRDDRARGSLRHDPTSHSVKAARDLVGVSSSRWD